jgi:hypothetical protein
VTRAPLRLLLCASLALVPLAARAADPNDPNFPLFSGNPCFALSAESPTVSGALSIADPNQPAFYSQLPDCAGMCKRVGASCARFAKRAAACAQRTANDRASFKLRVTCQGFSSGDPNCPEAVQTARSAERQGIADALAAELTACTARASDCTGKCVATP